MDYTRVLEEIFSQFNGPRFSIRFWNGAEKAYGIGTTSLFTLVMDTDVGARRLITEGALGFGESYMDGSLRVEGDIEACLRLRHQFKYVRATWRLAVVSLLAKVTSPHRRKDQIAQHYDLGNDFFSMILDPETMSYSAGTYVTANDTLGTAQQKKLEYICEVLALPENSRVLDLGSGWGGFAFHTAKNKKWNTVAYTLSNAQLAYCEGIVQKAGIENRVSLEYRDMLGSLPENQFDAVVAIESIEHVGKERLPSFFMEVAKALKPGGSAYIQATGRYKPRAVDPWTLKYVFPGGYLPAKSELMNAASAAGLSVEEFRDDTQDYIQTMATWIQNLEANQSAIEQKFDPSFYRLWYLWMHGAKVAFEENSMNLFRIVLKKPE